MIDTINIIAITPIFHSSDLLFSIFSLRVGNFLVGVSRLSLMLELINVRN